MSVFCPKCKLDGFEISIDQDIERGLPPLVMRTGAKAYECKKCEVVWGLLPAQGPITEADVFGDLSEFKHITPVEVSEQEDGGETLYRSLAKIPEGDQPLDKLLNRVLDQMQKLHQSGLNEAQVELAKSVIYLTSKVKYKLDPLNPSPAVLTRALLNE